MKRIKTLLVAGALGLGMASGVLYAQPADGSGPAGPPPGGRRMGPPKEILEKYDVNKDGKLDETERAALHQDVQDGKIQPPGRGPRGPRPMAPNAKEVIQKFDKDGDSKLDEAELTAFFPIASAADGTRPWTSWPRPQRPVSAERPAPA